MKRSSLSVPAAAAFAVLAAAALAALCVLVPDGQVLMQASGALHTGDELPAFTWTIQSYGLCLALSAVAAWCVSLGLCRKEVSVGEGVKWFALALALGLVLSRAVFCLAESSYYNPEWAERLAALRIMDGGMAMTGALAGILLAAMLVKPCRRMAALAAPLFVAGARFGERYTQVLGMGPTVKFRNFLTRQSSFSARLDVSLLEMAAALIIFLAVALFVLRGRDRRGASGRDGWALALFFILYGAAQVLMESLRKDQHLIWSFTKAQQITAILMAFGGLLYAAAVKRQYLRAFLYTLAAAAPLVGLEFALDKADVNNLWLYAAYILILAAYLFASLRLFKKNLEAQIAA